MQRRALLFTDVIDSTAIAERLGEAPAAALWEAHDRSARQLLAQHAGLEIDRTDGFFLLFDEAADAARCALAYQQLMLSLKLEARVGIHVGEVTLRRNAPDDIARGAKPLEVEGLAKPQAARIMTLARGGQVLLSAAARVALGAALPDGCAIEAHGHYRLKGVEEPVEVFEIGLEVGAFAPPLDTDKAYRVVRQDELWQPLREVRHNLAPERDAFIGRSAELRSLARRLDAGARLLTVAGSGGVGKTRFVRRYARAWLGDWPGGVTFCDLSEARSLDGIHFAVASALDVPLGRDDPSVQLGHAIAGRGRCLVILDNFEQVVEHAAATLGRWLDRAPQASFVVTSRELLHLPGEQVLPIEPLPLAGEAIELFAARARAQRPEFELKAQNHQAVSRIVELLDGLPLAIELAAARIRVLSAVQIVDRLRDRFALLAGARGSASRQATLEAAIDWSWELLSPWEQVALAQCSVFEGGFTLEAAETVLSMHDWPEAPPTIDVVQALVDKSLLRAWLPKEAARLDIAEPYFGMYLSIHAYAAQKLWASGAHAHQATQQRHGAYFARLGADPALEALCHPGGEARRRALGLELENLVAACKRAVERGDAGVGVQACRAAWEVLALRGPFSVGVTLAAAVRGVVGLDDAQALEIAICHADPLMRTGRLVEAHGVLHEGLARARRCGRRRHEGIMLAALGLVDREQGRLNDARAELESALAIHREVGNRQGEGAARQALGLLLDQLGLPDESRDQQEQALAIFVDTGNRHGIGQASAGLAVLSRHQGRLLESVEHYEEALVIFREFGDLRSEGMTTGQLANALRDLGRADEAQRLYEAALAVHRQVGSRTVEPYALANLGLVHTEAGRLDQARDCFVQALVIDREVNNRFHEGVVLSNLGLLEYKLERFDAAREAVWMALERMREVGNRLYIGMCLTTLCEILLEQRQYDRALAALAEAEPLLREIDNPLQLGGLMCARARVAIAMADRSAAQAAVVEAEALAGRLGVCAESTLMLDIQALRRELERPLSPPPLPA